MKIIFSILLNAFILFIMEYLLGGNAEKLIVDGITVVGGLKTYLLGGIILGIINVTIKPIIKILSLPLFLVFYGLILFVINAILLKIFDYIINNLLIISGVSYTINGWINFIIAVTIFTILNMLFSIFGFKKSA